MAETTAGSGLVSVELGDSLALFGDATGTPRGLDSRALAAAAGDAVEWHTGRAVPVLYARQEHTHLAFSFSAAELLPSGPHLIGTCDALLTAEPWTALTVRTADCLPIALSGGGVVAMVHAGGRGLAADWLGRGLPSRPRGPIGGGPGATRLYRVLTLVSLLPARREGCRPAVERDRSDGGGPPLLAPRAWSGRSGWASSPALRPTYACDRAGTSRGGAPRCSYETTPATPHRETPARYPRASAPSLLPPAGRLSPPPSRSPCSCAVCIAVPVSRLPRSVPPHTGRRGFNPPSGCQRPWLRRLRGPGVRSGLGDRGRGFSRTPRGPRSERRGRVAP